MGVLKRFWSAPYGIWVLLMILNAARYGIYSFISVVIILLVAVYYSQHDLIMNTAEQFQLGVWGKHMTLRDLKGKKVKFIWKRNKKKEDKQ